MNQLASTSSGWAEVDIAYDLSVKELCHRPYPNHPHGCPNYGKRRSSCPPLAPALEDVLDMTMPLYAIWNVFPFGEHVARMKKKHPDWSARQLACCLYWQGTARKQLREIIARFCQEKKGLFVLQCPEALGTNVTETMKRLGHTLECPPVTVAYQVAIAGSRNRVIRRA